MVSRLPGEKDGEIILIDKVMVGGIVLLVIYCYELYLLKFSRFSKSATCLFFRSNSSLLSV